MPSRRSLRHHYAADSRHGQRIEHLPPLMSRRLQMIIEPPQQNLVGRQPQKLFQRLAILQQPIQFRMMLDVNLAQQAPPNHLPDQAQDQVLSTLLQVGRTDIDDRQSDTFGGRNDNVVVFRHLECVQGFGLRFGLVEDALVDCFGDRVVDELGQEETVCTLGVVTSNASTASNVACHGRWQR